MWPALIVSAVSINSMHKQRPIDSCRPCYALTRPPHPGMLSAGDGNPPERGRKRSGPSRLLEFTATSIHFWRSTPRPQATEASTSNGGKAQRRPLLASNLQSVLRPKWGRKSSLQKASAEEHSPVRKQRNASVLGPASVLAPAPDDDMQCSGYMDVSWTLPRSGSKPTKRCRSYEASSFHELNLYPIEMERSPRAGRRAHTLERKRLDVR